MCHNVALNHDATIYQRVRAGKTKKILYNTVSLGCIYWTKVTYECVIIVMNLCELYNALTN